MLRECILVFQRVWPLKRNGEYDGYVRDRSLTKEVKERFCSNDDLSLRSIACQNESITLSIHKTVPKGSLY